MDKFYYGDARIRALEARLVSPPQLERMAAAPDFETAFNILSETPYTENLSKLKHPFDFEELFVLEEKMLKKLMDKLAPGDETIRALTEKDYSFLKRSSSPLIGDLAKHKLDLLNLKTLLRVKSTAKDKAFLAESITDTGFIDKGTLLSLYDKGIQEIISRLNFTVYFPEITEGPDAIDQYGSFQLVEKQADDFIVDKFRKAKYINSGVEPLVGFYMAKQAEIKTLRFIFVCKQSYVGSEQIKERIRVLY